MYNKLPDLKSCACSNRGSTFGIYKKATHCIFDVDGTLLDSEDHYQELVQSVVEKYGGKWSAQLAAELYGGTDRDICTRIVNKLNLPVTVDEVENELFDMGDKCLPQSPTMDGVPRLLAHLYKHRIPFAIASNSTKRTIDLYAVAKPHIFDNFHHRVCADDPELKRGKPAPDIYLLAASRFPDKPKPRNCIAFEDSLTGVKAARAAGMQVVMITEKPLTKEEARLPTILLRTLTHFKPELFGLPPFDDVYMPGRFSNFDWPHHFQDNYSVTGLHKKVTHCIFDVDGTLLDSEYLYQELVRHVVEKYGGKWSTELAAELYGGTDRDICTRIVQKLKLPVTVDAVEAELFDQGDKCLPQSPTMDGVARLLAHLHKRKVPYAIASNSTRRTIDLYAVAKPQIFDGFDHKVCADDPELRRGKPAPDIYILAASRFKERPKPRNCLVFEDSLTGVKAARAAGMQVVMITTKPLTKDEAKLPTILLRTLLDFKPEFFGLPSFGEG